MFKLSSKLKPTGDQPQAIKKLTNNLKAGVKNQVLLGVTGSGKTMSMAHVIQNIKKPVLVISPNKTLCAQLFQEFKEFFPGNAVHYFVSYYDYYQPEAYLPATDTYIEKDAKINEEIDRLRHAATQDLLVRNDVIIVASVSCIYNIGSPKVYQKVSLEIKAGQKIKRKEFLGRLTSLQYRRNDIDFKPGSFRVRGGIIEIYLVTGQKILRIEFSKDKIDRVSVSAISLIPKYKILNTKYKLFPAQFWVTPKAKLDISLENIRLELQETVNRLKNEKKLLEAQKLEQRTKYDLEMIKETGYCHGIENYSRHLEFRKEGDPPYTLLDYFGFAQQPYGDSRLFSRKGDPAQNSNTFVDSHYVVFVDESHLTIPQLNAMSVQDLARKKTLIEYGFRLPSAIDNRPLTFQEFTKKTDQVIYVSATPAEFEKQKAGKKYIINQLVRPTGLVEPSITIKPTKNQVKDLIKEIRKRIKKKERVLVATLTKRLAEDLSDFLTERGIKTKWFHSEIKTLERPEILRKLRLGEYDVLIGINLLREGLDLPEVSLVAILDADKEGFLRSEVTLIQTMGRAARHPKGHAILYADTITHSIKKAIDTTKRKRKIQMDYNKRHKISPKPITKEIREWPFKIATTPEDFLSLAELKDVKSLEKKMKKAAASLDFEQAAKLRDLILQLRSGLKN
ncbi:excinuclease ABC subunit UvrB [Patescibacteria group bacterium]|nr:excinuclease ABC subunit UvrB [Patescibacteria group bacterium]